MNNKFRKKPVVIEAEQFRVINNLGENVFVPDVVVHRFLRRGWWIKTLEGWYHVKLGDWIIKGVHGEYYPCKPDIFEKTYEEAKPKPTIVCLCGSSRFTGHMMAMQWAYAKEGIIALGWFVRPTGPNEPTDHLAEFDGVQTLFDELHKRKIDMSDLVMVLNIGGYIGESTRSEIEYAKERGKPIKYLEPIL